MEARAYIGWETPCRPGGGTGPLPPHNPSQGPLCKFKKNYIKVLSLVAWPTGPLTLLGWATGGIFENFQNRYIFLKFLFFLNIKRKKTRTQEACLMKTTRIMGPVSGPIPCDCAMRYQTLFVIFESCCAHTTFLSDKT